MDVRERQGRRSRIARRVENDGGAADSVDVATVAPVEGADAETEAVLNDGGTEGLTDLITRIASVGEGHFGTGVIGRPGQVGLGLDESDRPAFRAGAEQSSLWAAQHLDALEVE